MSISTEGVPVPEWTLADRLAKALRVADMTVSEMADYLDVHRNTVSAWLNERGKPPTRPMLITWALRTGVPFEWIKDGTAPQNDSGPDGGNGGAQPVVLPYTPRRIPSGPAGGLQRAG